MKRYNIFIIATLLLGAVLNTGCSDDFLQKSSLSASSSGNFWQTADDAYEGLTAQWKFSGDKHKSLQVDTERTFHQRYPLAML